MNIWDEKIIISYFLSLMSLESKFKKKKSQKDARLNLDRETIMPPSSTSQPTCGKEKNTIFSMESQREIIEDIVGTFQKALRV